MRAREDRKVRWEEVFPDELHQKIEDEPVCYLAYGLAEPHGPYNALGLDWLKARALVEQTAQRHGGVVAPSFAWHIQERREFQLKQQEDLEKASEDLRRAIQKINTTSRRKFLETFELINERFQEIFPILFTSGQAMLRLDDAEDPLDAGIEVHCLRDLTRGGLASALIEIAEASGKQIRIEETAVSIRQDVRGACELLGLDPLYVANEGRFVSFVRPGDAELALETMRSNTLGKGASIIGSVDEGDVGLVTIKSSIGTTRVVDMLSGEQLPRIC